MWRKNEFLVIWAGVVILTILVILGNGSTSGILGSIRFIFGCVFVAFVPGYALLAALLPKSTQLGFLERISIGFALSIAVLSVIALILDRLPWGITLWPIVIFLVGFSLLMTVLSLIRRNRLPEEERFSIPVGAIRIWWKGQPKLNQIAFGLLTGAVLVGATAFSIVYSANHAGIATTEFYMLSPEGLAGYYPTGTMPNVALKFGIGNYEHKPQTFTIHVLVDGQLLLTTNPILVDADQHWENELAIPISNISSSHTIDYQLFRIGDTIPYRSLRLEIHSP